MNRRSFLIGGGVAALAAGVGVPKARAIVPAHNWGKYDFGSGPVVKDRLNQGPFPQYPPEEIIPTDSVVMTTTPSEAPVENYGRGLETYITADMGTEEIKAPNIPQAIEDLVKFPLGEVLYIRPTWREIQPNPGGLALPDYIKLVLKLAKENNKRVAFRIQLVAPDYSEPSLPDFILKKVPMVKLTGPWNPNHPPKDALRYLGHPWSYSVPEYANPFFQKSFDDLIGLLAAEFNGNPLIEYMDTIMYGFWGEGHTWPFTNIPFPDHQTAERTWMNMLRVQLEHFDKTPLLTNTQPDIDGVGNSEMLDRTVRSNNWIRSDTIFIENQQIEELSNRPPWIGMALEQALPGRLPEASGVFEGVSRSDDIISHVMDIGANYWSLWNFHNINAKHLMAWYQAYPRWFNRIHRRIGYNVRPSFIWSYQKDGYLGLIIGFANDGIAGVPGVLRVTVLTADGKPLQSGCLDPGYPYPGGKVRQAQFVLPKGTEWQGLRLKAEIEIKGAMRRPVRWACQQKLNEDGTLTLRPDGPHLE